MNDYLVIESDSHEGLQAGVRSKLAEGWQCQGGIAVYTCPVVLGIGLDDNEVTVMTRYVQAMVRS